MATHGNKTPTRLTDRPQMTVVRQRAGKPCVEVAPVHRAEEKPVYDAQQALQKLKSYEDLLEQVFEVQTQPRPKPGPRHSDSDSDYGGSETMSQSDSASVRSEEQSAPVYEVQKNKIQIQKKYKPLKSFEDPPVPVYEAKPVLRHRAEEQSAPVCDAQQQPRQIYKLILSDYGGSETTSQSDSASVRAEEQSAPVYDAQKQPLPKNKPLKKINTTSPPTERSKSPPPDLKSTTSDQSAESPLPLRDPDIMDTDSVMSGKRHCFTRFMASLKTYPPKTHQAPFSDVACDTSDVLSGSDLTSASRNNITSTQTDRSKSPPPDLKEIDNTRATVRMKGVLISISGSPTEIALSIVLVLAAVWLFFGPFSSSGTLVPPSGSFGLVSFVITLVVIAALAIWCHT